MELDPLLRELLVCPACHGALDVDDAAERLVCTVCGLRYPVRDGIPVMLVDEAEPPAAAGSPAGSPAASSDAPPAAPPAGGPPGTA